MIVVIVKEIPFLTPINKVEIFKKIVNFYRKNKIVRETHERMKKPCRSRTCDHHFHYCVGYKPFNIWLPM